MASSINELLLEMVKTQAASGSLPTSTQNQALTNMILNAPQVQGFRMTPDYSGDIRGPSPVMRVLDVLSRPLYAVANPIKEIAERARTSAEEGATPGQAFQDLFNFYASGQQAESSFRGLTGKDKTIGRDVLEATGYKPEGATGFLAGLGADIALDPLTYVGFGLVGRIGKSAAEGVTRVDELSRATAGGTEQVIDDLIRTATNESELRKTVVTPPRGAPAPRSSDPSRTFVVPPEPPGVTPTFDEAARYGKSMDDMALGELRELATRLGWSSLTRGSAESIKRVIRANPDGPPGLRQGKSSIISPAAEPSNVREILEQTIEQGKKQWESLLARQVRDIPPTATRDQIIEILTAAHAVAKGPQKNMLRKQLDKLQEGIVPANITRKEVPEFKVTKIPSKEIDNAKREARKFGAINRFDEINPVGQTNLYQRIWNYVNRYKKVLRGDPDVIRLQMLRIAEEELISKGRRFVDAEGRAVRLSDIAQTAGGPRALNSDLVDKFRRGETIQAVEDVAGANAAVTAQEVADPIAKVAGRVAQQTERLSESRTQMLGGTLSNDLRRIAEEAGATKGDAKAMKGFVQELFNPRKDTLYDEIRQESRKLVRQSMQGKIDPVMLNRLTTKVYESLGANPKVLGKDLTQNKVVEGIMTKFATQWGAKDLRPFTKPFIDTARNVAAAFQQALTPLVRRTTPTQRHNAWRVTQGKAMAGSLEEQALADEFGALIENLMGVHGVRDGNAVLFRGGVTKNELNAHMPPRLKFIDTDGFDSAGRAFNYGGGDWMHSWKEWDIKEPAEALYQLVRGLQLVTRKNAMWDDVAARMGTPFKSGEFKATTKVPRMRGMYFPQEIADQINRTWNFIEHDKMFIGPKPLQFFDKLQRMWKTGVTIYAPSHHIRNLNGDIFLSWLDGVNTPTPYMHAFRAMRAMNHKYKDMEHVQNIMDPKLRDRAASARPGDIIFTTKGGHRISAEHLYEAAESEGVLLKAPLLEDLFDESTTAGVATVSGVGPKIAPFGGRVHGFAAGVSEMRDHYARLAHFADVLRKSKHANLRSAIEEAGRRVRKFHPDGSDLTTFERNSLRRLIPFYSWLRKSTPLVIEGIAMRPHVAVAFPKVMSNMQTITGIESEGPANPFPDDQLFPEWIMEKGVGPILPAGSPLAEALGRHNTWRGSTPGYTIINPTNVILDQVMELGNPRKTVESGLTPAFRIPMELITEETALGIPLSEIEGGAPAHIAQQLPPVGIAARISGLTRPYEDYHPEQLINYLVTGGFTTGTGPYQQQARFEIQDILDEMARRGRRDLR